MHDHTTRAPRQKPVRSKYAVLVWSGVGARVVLLPLAGEVVVGRASTCEIRIDDASISRRHILLRVGETVTCEDLGSRHGTRVDGHPIAKGQPVPFAIGSVVEIGDVTLLLQRASADLVHGLEARPSSKAASPDAVVADPAMKRLFDLLDVVAPSDVSVLVLGETGTGKEVYARELHRRSPRSRGPLLSLSCAALPESMLEAELFGYERGAFTGAVSAKPGLFESADGGTVFLDEIGELPLATQAKLLRVLETGETMRLGSVKAKNVAVRLVSATNRDLAVGIQRGAFRADLYFRLNGFVVTLPPLRDRPLDIDALVAFFVARGSEKSKRRAPEITDEARRALAAHAWPGNVRELRNVVDRAVLLAANGVIEVQHLDLAGLEPRLSSPRAGKRKGLWSDVDALERQRIVETLARCQGNQSLAAKELGIGRGTLLTKLDAFGIERPRKGK